MNILLSILYGLLLWGNPRPATTEQRGSIFLSKDEGSSWTRADTGLPPGTTINAWVTIPGGVIASTEYGIYTTQDGLKTWYSSNHGLPANLKIKTLVTHGGSVFAGSYLHGIYVSHDAGSSWQKSSQELGEISVRTLYSLDNVLYAGTDTGIYRSTDNGKHWEIAIQGMQVNDFTSWGNMLYAATNFGMLRSDGGQRWAWVYGNQRWVWVYGSPPLFNISADNGVVSSILPHDEVYTSIAGSNQGSILTLPFNQYTFRLTPTSSPLLRTAWRKNLRPLREQGWFKGRGLPEDKPLHRILKTPFGILVAVGRVDDGC